MLDREAVCSWQVFSLLSLFGHPGAPGTGRPGQSAERGHGMRVEPGGAPGTPHHRNAGICKTQLEATLWF